MAHPIKNVSNQAVLDALRLRYGLQFPPDFSLSGAQNSTFARRVFDHLRNSGQRYPSDVFSTGVTTAKDLELVNQKPDWSPEDKLLRTLEALGIDQPTRNRIYEEAKKDPANRGGIRQGGKEISTLAWQNATRRVLGDVQVVQEAERRAGLAPAAPAAPPPGAPGGFAPSAESGKYVFRGDVKPASPTKPAQPLKPPGPSAGTLGGSLGTTTTAAPSAGIRALPTLSPNATEEEVIKYIRKYYGYSAWTLEVPELRARMIEVARDFAGVPVDEMTIEGRFTDLEWWKTHSGNQRLAIEEKHSDPATYNAKIEGKYRELAVLTGQSGFSIPEARLRQIARDAYDMGWDQPAMRAALAAEFDYNPETGAQDQSALVADLRKVSSEYLVPLSEQTIDQWGRQIIAGTSTDEDFTAYAKTMAKGMFAHYANDIDAGRTVKQIADPFIEVAAKDLELTKDQINLMDPKWRKALELDPETGQPMQLSKWQRTIRSDSSYGWDMTQNARGEAAEFARKIAESFGRA